MQFAELIALPFAWFTDHIVALLSAIATLVAAAYLSRFAYRAVRRVMPEAYGVDKNFTPLLAQAAGYGIFILGIVTALGFLGVPAASMYAVVGAAGLAVALALQGKGVPPGPVTSRPTRRRGKRLGGCARTRTVDPLIKSQLLYHLSYAPWAEPGHSPRIPFLSSPNLSGHALSRFSGSDKLGRAQQAPDAVPGFLSCSLPN